MDRTTSFNSLLFNVQVHHSSLSGKPTCLAYDSVDKLLAIGCDNGDIVMYPILLKIYM